MAVVAGHRGAGVGAHLLGALLDRARSAGVAQVSLSVDPTNVVARRLYDRFGFERADVEPDPGGSLTLVVILGSADTSRRSPPQAAHGASRRWW